MKQTISKVGDVFKEALFSTVTKEGDSQPQAKALSSLGLCVHDLSLSYSQQKFLHSIPTLPSLDSAILPFSWNPI